MSQLNTIIQSKNATKISISLVMLLSTCVFDAYEKGELCVYTSLEYDQIVSDINAFSKAYPDIKLTCPWTEKDENSVTCELPDGTIGKTYTVCRNAPWQVLRESTSTLFTRLKNEGESTKVEVLWRFGITHLLDYALNYHELAPYKPEGIEDIEKAIKNKDDFPNNSGRWYIDPAYQDLKDEGVNPEWVGLTAYMNVFCVNATKMRTVYDQWTPADLTWENLVKPQCQEGDGLVPGEQCLVGWSYAGIVSIPRPDKAGTGTIMLSALLHYFTTQEDSPWPDGWSYFEALDNQVGQYTSSGTDPCKLVGDLDYGPSKIAVAITGEVGARNTDAAVDEDLLVLPFPDGSAGYNIEANAMLKKDSMNPLAHTLLDWGLSNDAFKVYITKTPLVSRPDFVTTYPTDFPLEYARTWSTYDFSEIASSRASDEAMWTERFCPTDDEDKCRDKEGDPPRYPINEMP